MSRIIFHCDCNGFYASVAEQVNPLLKDVPMAVCGDPDSRRGIILAKNELAKQYNIKTAETIWQAKQKCPHLVLAPTYRELYKKYYHQINAIYEDYTDLVERFGIDESFLDVTGSIHLFETDPVTLANQIRERVKKETGLTISIGVSYNKIFAKLGSDYKKPDAVTCINESNFKDLLWKLPVSAMFMVGETTRAKLQKLYINTIGELASTEKSILFAGLGKMGELLYRYANGLDDAIVVSYRNAEAAHTIGNGCTFKRNLVTSRDIQRGLSVLADSVAFRLRKEKRKCLSLQVTIKDANLKSITRQKGLDHATYLAKDLAEESMDLVKSSWSVGNPIRMLTITAGKLIPSHEEIEQISLFDDGQKRVNSKKQEDLEQTMDKLREKYGKDTIQMGSILDNDLGI